MKKTAIAGVVVALLTIGVGSAGADTISTLHITGWLAGGGGLHIWARTGHYQTVEGTFGAGSFRWQKNGVTQNSPLYCLDVFHTFNFGETWETQEQIIPPDPPDPPPFNTGEASWMFHKYGFTGNNAQAQGTQLALWEVSHDAQWRQNFDNPHHPDEHWWNTGSFRYKGSRTIAGFAVANTILHDAYEHYNQHQVQRSIYYQPYPYHQNSYCGQGMIGDAPPMVPEPGTLVLFGTGLLTLTGGALRMRRRGR